MYFWIYIRRNVVLNIHTITELKVDKYVWLTSFEVFRLHKQCDVLLLYFLFIKEIGESLGAY